MTSVKRTLLALALVSFAIPTTTLGQRVLILESSVSGGPLSKEALEVVAQGGTFEICNDFCWGSKVTTGIGLNDFDDYAALILGDPNCGSTPPAAAELNFSTWADAVTGNVSIWGTDPRVHPPGGDKVIKTGIAFALSGSGTGAYITTSCYYHSAPPGTAVPMLDGFGVFTAQGAQCWNDSHIVATHPIITSVGLTGADVSNWACSAHNFFNSWPSDFIPLVISRNVPGGTYVAGDGTVGGVYVLARGVTPITPCTDPPSGMVAWWPLDGTGAAPTKAKDTALFNNVGTHVGTPLTGGGAVAGAIFLSSVTMDYVNVPDHPELDLGAGGPNPGDGDFTIDAWVNCQAGTTGVRPIVDKRPETIPPAFRGYTLFVFNGRLGVQMADGGLSGTGSCTCAAFSPTSACTNHIAPVSSPTVCTGNWEHVAVTVQRFNAVGGNLFLNGAVILNFNPKDRTLSLDNGDALWIGKRHPNPCAPDSFWDGGIDEVEIFKRALDPSEIMDIFLADSAGKCKCEPLPDGSGCKATLCPMDPLGPFEKCKPTCVKYDKGTQITLVTDCDCVEDAECHVTVPAPGAGWPTCVDGCPPGEVCKRSETYNADGTIDICCRCVAPIPTVSVWGLVVLTLLLLTGAKIYFSRRQTATTS